MVHRHIYSYSQAYVSITTICIHTPHPHMCTHPQWTQWTPQEYSQSRYYIHTHYPLHAFVPNTHATCIHLSHTHTPKTQPPYVPDQTGHSNVHISPTSQIVIHNKHISIDYLPLSQPISQIIPQT